MPARGFLLCLLWSAIASSVLAKEGESPPRHAAGKPWEYLVDRTEEMGIDFVHFNGMYGELLFPEILGPGGALFDFDNDGDLDVYLVQGAELRPASDPRGDSSSRPRDRLFRNDLKVAPDGSRRVGFTDVTAESGIESYGYGIGVATGDFDNDGWVDLYVTNVGPNRLFRNDGDGTFTDATVEAGVEVPEWSSSASFFDFDRDGLLDLYVCNYVKYDLSHDRKCYAESSARDYCGPSAYDPEPDRLFHNLGNGTFEDVTTRALAPDPAGTGLGVVTADLNGDGWIDVYVANDGLPNQMWVNQGDGTFRNDALLAGVALNWLGMAEAGMGVDAADFDGDGDEDLFVTHLTGETNTLYVNDGKGTFEDRTLVSGLGATSLAYTSFGTAWFDLDNDGWLDLLILNGAVRILEDLARQGDPYPLHQPNQLFRNRGGGKLEEVTAEAGSAFEPSEVSRGAAFGDLDNDGDTDVLVLNNHGPARLLINRGDGRNHWLGLRLVGDREKRDMLGARVEVLRDDAPALWRRARADGSFCSANDPRVLVGLGAEDARSSAVRIYWPSGRIEEWTGIPIDRYTTLREGQGRARK